MTTTNTTAGDEQTYIVEWMETVIYKKSFTLDELREAVTVDGEVDDIYTGRDGKFDVNRLDLCTTGELNELLTDSQDDCHYDGCEERSVVTVTRDHPVTLEGLEAIIQR